MIEVDLDRSVLVVVSVGFDQKNSVIKGLTASWKLFVNLPAAETQTANLMVGRYRGATARVRGRL